LLKEKSHLFPQGEDCELWSQAAKAARWAARAQARGKRRAAEEAWHGGSAMKLGIQHYNHNYKGDIL
jgi:hypothetical protein